MSFPPQLTEKQIRSWIDAQSLSRGQRYAQSGAVVHPRLEGATLKAECWGSADQPYHVEITFDDEGIVFGDCSCPVGAGGRCKHVAAVLLTWLSSPDSFQKMKDLEESLSRLSKEELARIIVKIVDTYPEAELIVLMPLPGSSAAISPLDADIIRRQVRHVTDHFPREWGASYAAAAKVAALISPGDEYAAAGDWQNAAVVYATIADVILEDYHNLYEEEGEFVAIVAECADGLVDCLDHAADPILRRALLETLFRIWQWDITMGGVGTGDSSQAAMVEETTETEKALVAEWVRRALPESDTDSYSSGWKRGVIGGFLLELEGDRLDDESYLRICRETGRLNDLVRRLLQLKRIEEATKAARQAGDYALLGLVDVFQAAGHEQVVAGLIRERLPQSRDTRLFEWLISYDMVGQRYEAALGLSRQLFALRPDVQTYVRVSEAAQRLGNWDTVRPALLDELRQAKHYEVCVQIFLHEGQIDSALDALATLRRAYPYASDHMVLAVAHAAEAERPQAAIDLYVQAATQLIDRRGRTSYAEAAQVLARARALLLQTNQAERWTALITQIRQENRRLPALQDELNRAEL